MSNGKYKDSKTANKDAFWAPELQHGKLFGKKDRLLKQQYEDFKASMKRKKKNGPS